MKTVDLLLYAFIGVMLLFVVVSKLRKPSRFIGQYEYRAVPVLSSPEQALFFRLREALPACIVLAQVSMHRVIRPKSGGKAAFNAISQNAIDFVICRKDFSVVCVVELDDSSHDKAADFTRDTYMTSAGIETFRWHVRTMPAVSDIYNAMRKFDLQ